MSYLKSLYTRYTSNLKGFDFPIERMICKGFATPEQTNHYHFLVEYEKNCGSFNPETTDYFKSINNESKENHTEFYQLPEGLSTHPTWWIMPWGGRVRSPKKRTSINRLSRAKDHACKLIIIHELIKKNGYSPWKGGAISGYLLKHPEFGELFNYIDGHHRLAVSAFLLNHGIQRTDKIKILPIATIERETMLELPSCKNGIKAGYFTKEDALLLFDNAFEVIRK